MRGKHREQHLSQQQEKTKVALRHSEGSSSQNNKTSSYLFMFSRSNHRVYAGRLIRWWKKSAVCVCQKKLAVGLYKSPDALVWKL